MRNRVTRCLFVALIVLATSPLAAQRRAGAESKDWTQWRGPQRNGISPETGLLKSWPDDGPPLTWRTKGLGKGYSSVAISDGRIFTMGRRGPKEHLIALSIEDGKELWATEVGGASHSNCTPTVDGNLVFALGRNGDLVCANADSGKLVWKVNYSQEFGGRMMSSWGYSESPLVDGDKLICTPGGSAAMVVALDKKTGKTLWATPRPDDLGKRGKAGAGYSSIVVSQAGGVRQYVQLTGKGVISVRASDGELLWTYNRIANGTANIPTPIVKDNYVFCSSGYNTGAALLKISRDGDDWTANEEYFLDHKVMQNHHGGMVMVGDYIYCGHGNNKGFPLCIEWKTGKVAWSEGRGAGSGSAAVAYADGNLYFRYQNAVMALIGATPQGYELRGKFKFTDRGRNSWPHPAISGGKLYLREQDELFCYDIRQQ